MMPSLGELLEREAATVDLEPGDFERMLRRRERKQRDGRIRAGAVAILVLVLTAVGLGRAFRAEDPTADHPTPRPEGTMRGVALGYALDGDIYVSDWNGENPVRIADGHPPGECTPGGPGWYHGEGSIWSPDGRYLAYRYTECGAAGEDWGDVVISDPEGNFLARFHSPGWDISWSPDSKRVAVWARFEQTIGVYGLDGKRQTLLTVPPGVRPPGDYDPMWARDGESLLLPKGIIVPLDGSAPRKLPSDDPQVHQNTISSPTTYSPDGSRVAYIHDGALVVASADGSGARELVHDAVWNEADWSPTGDQIAFVYNANDSLKTFTTELRVIDVVTGQITRVTGMDETAALLHPQFSPDGERILFTRYSRTGDQYAASLWTVAADGSDARMLVDGSGWGEWKTLPEAR